MWPLKMHFNEINDGFGLNINRKTLHFDKRIKRKSQILTNTIYTYIFKYEVIL